MIGAGLAGLAAARRLAGASLDVVLVEAADRPGGRVRTDRQDGFLLDRGFQLLNPAYPEVRREVDLRALRLQPFDAGVVVASGRGRFVLADPLRSPRDAAASAAAPVGSVREKAAFAAWAVEVGYGPAGWIKHGRPDGELASEVQRRGLGRLGSGVLTPFLAGVLADDALVDSRRFGELLIRSFVRGTPAVPAEGMQAVPDQLAASLPDGVLHLDTAALQVTGDRVVTDAGTVRAAAVVVATDPSTAERLTDVASPPLRGLTTFYHRAAEPPSSRALLHVDADRRGPVVNTAVVSNAAPSYARDGALVATTVLGARPDLEPAARAHAALIYGVDASGWDHLVTYAITAALPALLPATPLRRPVDLGDGRFVAGDHRDTSSLQGALVSGRRAADAVLARLRNR